MRHRLPHRPRRCHRRRRRGPPMARRAVGRPLLRGAPPRRAVARRPVGRRCHRGGRHWRRDAPAADLHGRRRPDLGIPGRCLRHRGAGALAWGVGRPCDAAWRVADRVVVRGPGPLPRQRHRRVRPHRHAAEACRRPLERHSRARGAGDASLVAADPQHAQQHRAAGFACGADRPRGPRRRWRRADAPRRPVGAGAWLLAALRSPVAGVASDRPGEGDARRTAGSGAARAADRPPLPMPTLNTRERHACNDARGCSVSSREGSGSPC